MRFLALGAILFASAASAQQPVDGAIRPPLSPRNANYSIDARLDPASRTITGSEMIAWRNITKRTAADLQFHLYWNAWRNNRSTFLREGSLAGRNLAGLRDEDWSRIDVTSIKLLASGGSPPPGPPAPQHLLAPPHGHAEGPTGMAAPPP